MVETKLRITLRVKRAKEFPEKVSFSELLIVKINLNYTLHITENSMSESITGNIQSPGREIKFIDLQPTDRLFYAIKMRIKVLLTVWLKNIKIFKRSLLQSTMKKRL